MKIRQIAASLLLTVALLTANGPVTILAHDNGRGDSGLPRSGERSPIGVAAAAAPSNTYFAIDGRPAGGEQLIWGGELIEASREAAVRVVLQSSGQVSVSPASIVRLTETQTNADQTSLTISLLRGSFALNLAPSASATLQALDKRFKATAGANVKLALSDGQPRLSILAGDVIEQQTQPTDVNIRLIDDLGRPISSGAQFSIRARATRQIQVQVTDKNDKPLPDLPVVFSLGDPCLGTIGLAGLAGGAVFQKKTDKKGIAAVILTAGAAKCAASITARVEGTNASVELKASVEEKHGFWTTRNTLLVTAAIVGAGIGIGFAVANAGSSEPIRVVPPPGVKP